MNAKQRRQHKRKAIRIASEIVDVSISMLRRVESGMITFDDALKELEDSKRKLKSL